MGPAPILIVDDDQAILDFLRDALTDEGYEVITAADGLDALERVRERRPCLILLDVRMPRMDGWAFLAARRETWAADTPVVVFTAARRAQETAEQMGATAFLEKPCEVEELLSAISRHASVR